jgi:putative ATPase
MEQPGLFDHQRPLAASMRPTRVDDVVGQDHLLTPGSPLRLLADPEQKTAGVSVVLFGPPGTGKTTLAQVVARSSGRAFMELSAVTAGVKDVREVMDHSRRLIDQGAPVPVLFLDEIHRFSKAQQDALLPGVENGLVVLIAATTENPSFSIIHPLLSRSLLLRLEPLSDDALRTLISRALTDERGLGGRVTADADTLDHIVRLSSGDARRALTALEAAANVARSRAESNDAPAISREDIESAINRATVSYDRAGDQHYDVISAFIKSVRGSDVDAAIHYLARMVEAGEDPRFIARRLVILASEDVGLADPQALVIAQAAADAVSFIGMPEGRIPLAEATAYLALAPKSNASYVAINEAISDIRQGKAGVVPPHLRDAHYPGAKTLGHGRDYVYSHDEPHGVNRAQYLPDSLRNTRYYRPTGRGTEATLGPRYQALRAIIDGTPSPAENQVVETTNQDASNGEEE